MHEGSHRKSETLQSDITGRTVLWAAVLQIDNRAVECVITNISAEGATISLPKPAICSETLLLTNERLGTLEAEVVWQNGSRVQLRFKDDTDMVALKVAEAILFG